MAYPKKNKSFGEKGGDKRGGRSFGGGKGYGAASFKKPGFTNKRSSYGDSGSRSDVQMHSAICAECEQRCQVPFKPNGRKPILCSNCFVKEDSGGKRFGNDNHFEKPSYTPISTDRNAEQFKTINAKLDAIMKALAI